MMVAVESELGSGEHSYRERSEGDQQSRGSGMYLKYQGSLLHPLWFSYFIWHNPR